MPHTFGIIKKHSLREEIAQVLRDKLLNGELRPGDRIFESRVASQMHVGQNSVREALQILEHAGLVTKIPKRGTFVTQLTDHEVAQAYRVRAELEGLAVEFATERVDDETLEKLESHVKQMTSAFLAGDFVLFTRHDMDFHQTIWKLAGNRLLEKALWTVTQPLFAYLLIQRHAFGTTDIQAIEDCHQRIISQMKSRNPSQSRDCTREQILNLWKTVLNDMKINEGGTSSNGS